jgi:tRNA threonylcarbamoyladenosine biosynthesis protein TsaB
MGAALGGAVRGPRGVDVLILGIDTATDRVSCAIGSHDGVVALVEATGGRRHAEAVTPMIAEVCRLAGVAPGDVAVVAVDIGPGMFTGLRVGLAAAKGVALALGVPMIGIPSLDLVAFPLRYCPRLVVPVLDARRGEVFAGFYRQVPGGIQQVAEPAAMRPDELASELLARGEEALLVGDGARRYAEVFAGDPRVELADGGPVHPSAGPLVQLAHARALREEWVAPAALAARYLRKPDAEINWDVRSGVER